MSKVLLRKTILARRLALSASELSAYGKAIQGTFIALPEYQAAASIALYTSVRNEVSTEDIIDHALLTGKDIFLPALDGDRMEFRQLVSRERLMVGRFGIMEPEKGSDVADVATIGMIVVPGVGFDLSGQRIGYGKGYYDRALHVCEGSGRLTALCFECQIVDSLAGEKHDVVMDRIITERRIITPALLK
ncbi:MAG: 5-formyltetrahydrofolate cyclo-ligase [Geobacteraceae bacterium]|nr:5-formyltetrahydrofolate cyclo-ligase [Geobacteraceae bacterium]